MSTAKSIICFFSSTIYQSLLAGTDQGREGEGGINVRSCYTGSSNKFEDAQEQTSTQVPNHDKFFDAQTTLWPSDIAGNQRAPEQLQLDECIYVPFSLGITVVFSLSADVSQMPCYRINCKVALNWSVALSCAHVLCARLFMAWTRHWSPHMHTLTRTDTPTHPPKALF